MQHSIVTNVLSFSVNASSTIGWLLHQHFTYVELEELYLIHLRTKSGKTISRIEQNPEWTKSQIGQNPEYKKSRFGQNFKWKKFRIGQNPELNQLQK